MQHSSLNHKLLSGPQSVPQLSSDRKAASSPSVTGRKQTTRCAAEEGLQLPKWPQQTFRRNLPTPQKLCGLNPKVSAADGQTKAPQTVYTVRISTGSTRGSAMTEGRAGVWLCLINRDGAAFLHRATPLSDPEVIEHELIEICQSANKEAGANCKNLSLHRGKAAIKQRFQTGSVDEVCFLGPELGPLAGLMVGPEQGGWQVDEITVVSSRTGHVDRFLCRQRLGYRADKQAEYLTPVPSESVVYGSGETAVVLSKDQAAALHAMGMMGYRELKGRLMSTTAFLVACGSLIAFSAGGAEAAYPFAVGGSAALGYQWLLQQSVDSIPNKIPRRTLVKRVPIADAIQRITSNPGLRFGFMTALALTGIWAIQNWSPDSSGTTTTQVLEARQMMTGLLGFMMWKLAVVGVTTVPVQRRQPALDEMV